MSLTFLDEVIWWWSFKIHQQVLHWGKFWVLDLLSKRREPFGYWSNNLPNNIRQGTHQMSILSTREIIETKQETLKESSYIRRNPTHNFRIHILRMISILWKSQRVMKKSQRRRWEKKARNQNPIVHQQRWRERERESFQRKLTLPSNDSAWSGMALGGTINVMAQSCGTLDVEWSFQKERNRQLLLELSPHMRENIMFWNEMGNSRNWTNGPHSGTRLICCGVIYILQSVADAAASRVLVSTSLSLSPPTLLLSLLFFVFRGSLFLRLCNCELEENWVSNATVSFWDETQESSSCRSGGCSSREQEEAGWGIERELLVSGLLNLLFFFFFFFFN